MFIRISDKPSKAHRGAVPSTAEGLSFDLLSAAKFKMRASLPACLLLSLLLASCASTKDTPVNKNISQNGLLKVHPGLLGQPVPKELQPVDGTPATPPAAPAADPATTPSASPRS